MSSEAGWQISELGKEAINASRPFSFKTHPQVVFVNTGDVLEGNFLHSNISIGKDLPGQAKKALRKDDILLTEIRPGNGRFAYVDFDVEKYVVSTKFMVIESLGRVSPRFLYHVLTNQASLDEFQRIAESRSGTFPQITFDSIAHFPIPIPSKQEQAVLVEFLDCIQDRITLLRETNATLEIIAQAMFKSWFIDFDPVHAKQQGCAPEGMSEATAALFPGSFEESELGLVPRGWKIGKVDDFAKQHKGSINPLKNPETLYEHFSLPAFDSQHMPVLELGTEIKSNKTSVPSDAVLLSKLNPHIPRIWLPVDVGSNAVCSTEFLVFVPVGGASKEFIYCAFTTPKFKELLCQLVTGTSNSHQRVKPDGVSSMSAVLPPPEVLEVFADVVKPMFERIGHNLGKAQTLATLRDTLLPRLISGQLRLPDVQIDKVKIEEVA